jgi:hypothetical protein
MTPGQKRLMIIASLLALAMIIAGITLAFRGNR